MLEAVLGDEMIFLFICPIGAGNYKSFNGKYSMLVFKRISVS